MHHTLIPDDTLLLRTWSRRDTVLLHALITIHADFLRKWLPWVDERQALNAVDELINQTQMSMLGTGNHFYGIWENGELVGEIAHHETTQRNRSTSVSYWLAESAQGRGVATRSLRCLLDYLFGELGMNRVEVRIAEGNIPSLTLAKRFGFQPEGILREAEWLYDRFVNHVSFSLLASEWAAAKQSQ